MVEFVAALVLGLPLVVAMIYATLQINLLFTIRTNLDTATRRAAQLLINRYKLANIAPVDGSNTNLPTDIAFDVKTGNSGALYFINKTANQFTWTWDLAVRPATITVTTTFPTNGANSLVRFPSPDPLKMGNGFIISTTSTFPVPPPN